MKTKNLAIGCAFLFLLVLLISSVSANTVFTSVSGNSSTVKAGNTVTVNFKLTEDDTGAVTDISFNTPITMTKSSYDFSSSNSVTDAITILAQNTESSEMSLTFNIPYDQELGTYIGTLTVSGSYDGGTTFFTEDLPISITVQSPEDSEEIYECNLIGDQGDLEVEIEDISVKGFGDDEEWYPFDVVEVEVTISNNNNDYDMEDLELSWGLWDGNDWFIDGDEDKIDVDADEEETITFTFTLDDDVEDLDDGDYTLYVWVEGDFEDDYVDDGEGSDTAVCGYDYNDDVEIQSEKDFVILDGLPTSKSVSCGEILIFDVDVWNIGSKDQDDVSVVIYNDKLGIKEIYEFEEIESFESEDLAITLNIPESASDSSYLLKFEVRDEDGDIYESDGDDESTFTVVLNMQSCSDSQSSDASVSVTANLESEAKAGEELIVKAVIQNTASTSQTYTFKLEGYESWASLVDVSPSSATINSGSSQEVFITLSINEGVSEKQSLTLNTYSGSESISSQPISVNVEKSGFNLSSLFDTGLTWVWVIGGVNLLLIILIIFVVIKLLKK